MQRLMRPPERGSLEQQGIRVTNKAKDSARLRSVTPLREDVENRLHNGSKVMKRRKDDALKSREVQKAIAEGRPPPGSKKRPVTPLSEELEQRLYTGSASRLRRQEQRRREQEQEARFMRASSPGVWSPPGEASSDAASSSDTEVLSDASSAPSESAWAQAAEMDLEEMLSGMEEAEQLTAEQSAALLRALRQSEAETVRDLDFLAPTLEALRSELGPALADEEGQEEEDGLDRLWDVLEASRAIDKKPGRSKGEERKGRRRRSGSSAEPKTDPAYIARLARHRKRDTSFSRETPPTADWPTVSPSAASCVFSF